MHLNEDENHCVNFIISEGLTAEVFEIAYNDTFDEVLYENFIEKEKYEKAKYEKAKEYLKAKGKDYLKTASDGTKALLKIRGNILSVLKMIVVKIGSAIKEGYKKVVAATKSVADQHEEELESTESNREFNLKRFFKRLKPKNYIWKTKKHSIILQMKDYQNLLMNMN